MVIVQPSPLSKGGSLYLQTTLLYFLVKDVPDGRLCNGKMHVSRQMDVRHLIKESTESYTCQ